MKFHPSIAYPTIEWHLSHSLRNGNVFKITASSNVACTNVTPLSKLVKKHILPHLRKLDIAYLCQHKTKLRTISFKSEKYTITHNTYSL